MTADDLINSIAGIRKNLAEEIDAEEWGNARVSMRQLSDALDQLSERLDGTKDVDAHDALMDVYLAASEQYNDAADKLMHRGRQR